MGQYWVFSLWFTLWDKDTVPLYSNRIAYSQKTFDVKLIPTGWHMACYWMETVNYAINYDDVILAHSVYTIAFHSNYNRDRYQVVIMSHSWKQIFTTAINIQVTMWKVHQSAVESTLQLTLISGSFLQRQISELIVFCCCPIVDHN